MKLSGMWLVLLIPFIIVLPALGQQTAEEYFNKGVGLYEAKNYNEAVTAFEKAIELKPKYVEAHYNLGVTYWQQKQYKKVSEELQKVLELAPGSDRAKQAAEDIKKLKAAGVYSVPNEEDLEEDETPIKSEPSEKPKADLPELIEDLRFGPTSKRMAAAKWLGYFPEEKAVEALGKTTEKSEETPEIKMAAVESLGKIALPSAIPFLHASLEAPDFPAEGKQAVIEALNAINTTESLKVILQAWAGTFPGGLSDQAIVEMIRKKGKEDFADIIRPAYLNTTGEKKMAMAMALGILRDTTGVPLMINRLKEDYPDNSLSAVKTSLNQPTQQFPGGAFPPQAGGPPIPGGYPGVTPILRNQPGESEGWSRKDETELRVKIVEVLGACAGANQTSFLTYLSKNDQEKKVRETALEAVKNLDTRIAASEQAYQKGAALAKEGKITEAIPLIQTALKENPDAPYAEEIKKLQARFNYDRALALLKEKKNEEAVSLLRSALELYPEAPFRKDAEDRLAKLQEPIFPEGIGRTLPGGGPLPPPTPRR